MMASPMYLWLNPGPKTMNSASIPRPRNPWLLPLFLCCLLPPAAFPQPADSLTPPHKKLIATGWDNPTTAQFRRDIAAMEAWPFDGAVVNVAGRTAEGKDLDAKPAFSSVHWERQFFTNALTDLQAAHSAKLTDNFLMLLANPGNVDWFDDAGWKEIVEHWRILAWLACAGGMKGILFDPEPYHPPFSQFKYSAQPRRSQHTFEAYCRQARERGREVMRAAAAEFPDLTVFSYFLFGECAAALGAGGDPQAQLADHGYGLLPAFTSGWFDAMPPGVTVIDGNESAYRYNSEAVFNAAFVRIKNDCQAFVPPAQRAKYRAQLQVSHGIYLDAYVNPPTSPWYIDGLGGPRVDRLEENVASALRAADEYVWVYGEKARWWPLRRPEDKARPTWPEVLPGADTALLSAKDPVAGARGRLAALRSRGGTTNLLANGDFSAVQNGKPVGWGNWQDEKESHGKFSGDESIGAGGNGSACLSGVQHGCWVQGVNAPPGRRFLVTAKVRQSGSGSPSLTVRWQTAEGKWTAESRDVRFAPAAGEASAWREIIGSVKVPEGAGRLVVLLGAGGQNKPEDRIWYDDAAVIAWE